MRHYVCVCVQDLLWNLEMESDGDENSDEAEHITREKLHSLIQHILDCLSGSEVSSHSRMIMMMMMLVVLR